MLKRILVAAGALVLVLLAAAVYVATRGPDLSAYERFREPAVLTMPPQKVLVVEVAGDPNAVGGAAFEALFAAYHKLDGVTRGPGMPAPRARWPQPLETPRGQWLGVYALPVPETVVALPPTGAAARLVPRLDTWQYGDVAQILHVGPYGAEPPTVERLHAFIRAQGYEVAGDHEEEYLRGPGMFGKGDPARYYTLIRYPIRRPARGG
jgi:effector-binding domain-containing protein